MDLMRESAEFLTVLSCGLFAGAAVFINLVEHPARMECGTQIAVTEFRPSYRRAAVMQASLALLCLLAAVVAWLTGASRLWLVGGVLTGLVVPFTLLAILPTNRRLLDASLDKGSERARGLLSRWGKLHAVRSGLSFVAFALFLYTLVFRRE